MRKLFYLLLLFIISILVICIADFTGIFWHNEIFANRYPIKGIDISHYQELIDWDKVKNDNVNFAFIKATEGTGHIDSYFSYNWEEAKRVDIYRGAYHFFTMKYPGKEQGEYFISVVPKDDDALPPVIDVEIGLDNDKDKVLEEVRDMSLLLEEYYNKRPIIYMDLNVYNTFFENSNIKNKIWIREIYIHPDVFKRTGWRFWQYSERGSVQGINGPVDLNAYRGDLEDFLNEFNYN